MKMSFYEITHLLQFPHKILWSILTHSSLPLFFGGRGWSSQSKNNIVALMIAALHPSCL
jgi:hypothetical protein